MNYLFRIIEYVGSALLLVIAIYSVATGEIRDALVVTFATAAALAPLFLKLRYNIGTPPVLRAGLVLFLFTTIVLGEMKDFYETYWWWDLALHSSAGFGITIAATIILGVTNKRRRHPLTPILLATFATTIAISISVGWEIYEFFMDMFIGSNMQPSADDTMWDLIGASTASIPAAYASFKWHQHHKPDGIIESVIHDGVIRNGVQVDS